MDCIEADERYVVYTRMDHRDLSVQVSMLSRAINDAIAWRVSGTWHLQSCSSYMYAHCFPSTSTAVTMPTHITATADVQRRRAAKGLH